MSAAKQLELISVENYLADEILSEVRHEYRDAVGAQLSLAELYERVTFESAD